MEILTGIGWFILSILVAFALYFFIIPAIKRFFTFMRLAIKIWLIARKQKDPETKKNLDEIAKGLTQAAKGNLKDGEE